MKRRKRTTPEIPLTSTADVAFLLLIFFLVAASSQSDSGRTLDLPGTIEDATHAPQAKNPQVVVTSSALAIDGELLPVNTSLTDALRQRLANAKEPSQRVVMLASDGTVTYQRWSDVVSAIEEAGGIPAPQMDSANPLSGNTPAEDSAP